MRLLLLALCLLFVGCAAHRKPVVDPDGCWINYDGCNRCCPISGGMVVCTLVFCAATDQEGKP